MFLSGILAPNTTESIIKFMLLERKYVIIINKFIYQNSLRCGVMYLKELRDLFFFWDNSAALFVTYS